MTAGSLKYWLALLVLCGAFCGWSLVRANRQAPSGDYHATSDLSSGRNPVWPPMTDFQLTDQSGKPFDSATLRGHVWVASFFFTNCPAICWRLNQALAALQATMGDSDVRFVSITSDPHNDTPAALDRYARHFKADPQRWTFLTGDIHSLRDIANRQFLVALDKDTHSSRVFAVDRRGQVRAMFSLTEQGEPERLKKLLAKLEAEPVPELPGSGATAAAGESNEQNK